MGATFQLVTKVTARARARYTRASAFLFVIGRVRCVWFQRGFSERPMQVKGGFVAKHRIALIAV
ncbi:hypothetical protein BZM26_14130 [Paraburkholderia strydomiana]|nr:hypothetical protein BZM26_14130 [Paraburkholderia strydomiana]